MGTGELLDVLDAGHEQRLDGHGRQAPAATPIETAVGFDVDKDSRDPDLAAAQVAARLRRSQLLLCSVPVLLAAEPENAPPLRTSGAMLSNGTGSAGRWLGSVDDCVRTLGLDPSPQ